MADTEKKPKPKVGDVFEQSTRVRASGIYAVLHNGHGVSGIEVTCVAGKNKRFPPCRECKGKVQFKLKYIATHVRRVKWLGD